MVFTVLLSSLGIPIKTKLLKKYYKYFEYKDNVFLAYIIKKHKIIYTHISNDGNTWLTIEQFILNGEKF
jgi:hypothetical protein